MFNREHDERAWDLVCHMFRRPRCINKICAMVKISLRLSSFLVINPCWFVNYIQENEFPLGWIWMDDHTTYIKSYIAGYEEVWVVQNLIENQCSHYMCQMENNCNKPTLTTLLPLLGKECDGKNCGAYDEQKLSARPAGPALIDTCLSMFFLGCSRCDSMYNTCGFVCFFLYPPIHWLIIIVSIQ